MNNTELTLSYTEQMFAAADELRRAKMIQSVESLIAGTDNEIIKGVYQNALRKIKEGWPC